jgi:hypothetical protein
LTAISSESVLVVAFDGLDYELIKEFGLQNITQSEFGRIDNQTNTHEVKTSELFASFITGEDFTKHEVKGLKKPEPLASSFIPNYLVENVRGFHSLKNVLGDFFKTESRYYDKTDLESETLFDRIDNSRALYVPSYNPSPYWMRNGTGKKLEKISVEEKPDGYYWDVHEHLRRRKEVFTDVNKWFDFCMIHFFRPDMHQHLYGDPNLSTFDKEKLRKLYMETDELAGEILQFFGDDYDKIIFMSDHGLPTEKEHNENAFYSCNKELFPNSKPHITSFYNKILDSLNKFKFKSRSTKFKSDFNKSYLSLCSYYIDKLFYEIKGGLKCDCCSERKSKDNFDYAREFTAHDLAKNPHYEFIRSSICKNCSEENLQNLNLQGVML